MSSQSPLEQQVMAKEKELLATLDTGDLTRFGELMADEALFVNARGAAAKQEVLKNVVDFRISGYTMDEMHFIELSETAGLLSYKLQATCESRGRQFESTVFVSSVWAKRSQRWVCLLSQETAAK